MTKRKYFQYIKVRNIRSEELRISGYDVAEKYNICTIKIRSNKTAIPNKPHYQMIKFLMDYYIKNNEIIVEEMYNNDSGRLIKVYPVSLWSKVMEEFLGNNFSPNKVSGFTIDKTVFNFILKQIQ